VVLQSSKKGTLEGAGWMAVAPAASEKPVWAATAAGAAAAVWAAATAVVLPAKQLAGSQLPTFHHLRVKHHVNLEYLILAHVLRGQGRWP